MIQNAQFGLYTFNYPLDREHCQTHRLSANITTTNG